jgi:hypothetical protein
LLITIGVFSILSAIGSPNDFQSDHRLLPLFLFGNGQSVYGDPTDTPIFSPIYAPLSFLTYFPALLFRTPTTAIYCAKIMAQLLTVGPLLWLLWRRRTQTQAGADVAIVLMGLALVAISASRVLDELTILHADAPALFFCLCVCVLTEQFSRSLSHRLLWGVSLCCVLAPWAKQPTLAIVLVPIIALLRLRLWKALWQLLRTYAIWMVLSGFVFLTLFRHQRMLFWIIEVPRLEMHSVNIALIKHAIGLALSFRTIWLLLAILAVYLVLWALGAKASSPSDIESILLFASVIGIPESVIGLAKPGGWNNTLLYFAYFAFLLFLLWIQRLAAALHYSTSRIALFLRLVLVALVVLAGIGIQRFLMPNVKLAWSPRDGSRETVAYEFMRKHPGEVWFSRYPLAGYLAEGKLYHCDMGFLDRVLARLPTPDSLLDKYMPNGGRVMACADDCSYQRLPLTHYYRTSIPELPGWTVWERRDRGTFHLDGR